MIYMKISRQCLQSHESAFEDFLLLVVSLNLKDRHLDAAQRARVATRLVTIEQGERSDLAEIFTKLSQPKTARMHNVPSESEIYASKAINQ